MKVMIVDDEKDIVRLVSTMCRVRGCQTIESTSGDECRALIKNGSVPDLLVLDAFMETSGFEICSWIKNDRNLSKMPVVMISASISPNDIEKAYQSGADVFVQKPFDMDEFFSVIWATAAAAGVKSIGDVQRDVQ